MSGKNNENEKYMAVYCELKYPNVFSTYDDLKHMCLHHTDVPGFLRLKCLKLMIKI